jgi:hypothetical protein
LQLVAALVQIQGNLQVDGNIATSASPTLLPTAPTRSPTSGPGMSSGTAAASCNALRGLGMSTNGVYWILWKSVATQIYCILNPAINGGGWMHVASARACCNFDGNTGAAGQNGPWAGNMVYSYGTYVAGSTSASMWLDFSQQGTSQLLFISGNVNPTVNTGFSDSNVYWISFPIATVGSVLNGHSFASTNSANFGGVCNPKTYSTVLARPGYGEDPWINAGDSHSCGSNYMFWGEINRTVHLTFRSTVAGTMLFVR